MKAPKRGFLEGTKLTRPKEEKGETKTTVQDAVKSSVETSENMQGQFEFKIHRSDSPEEREEMPDNSDDLFSSDDESFSSGVENLPEDDLEEKIISQMYSGEDKTAEPMPEERADRRISENHKKNPRSSKGEIESGIQNIQKEIGQQEEKQQKQYHFPPIRLLKKGNGSSRGDSDAI